MQHLVEIPYATFGPGASSTPVALPDWVRRLVVDVARCTPQAPHVWPSELQFVEVTLETSWDHGAHWVPLLTFGAYGGIYVRKDGTIARYSTMRLPHPGGGLVRLRFVSDAPVRTAAVITGSDV